MRPARLLVAGLIAEALLMSFATPQGGLETEKGKELFSRRCSGCHALDIDKEGPRLRGVYGRKAAGVPGFVYSDPMKKVNLQWNEDTLDQWLSNPDAVAPDTDMAFKLSSSEERKAVIAYLKSLSGR
jgi:cytochrome c